MYLTWDPQRILWGSDLLFLNITIVLWIHKTYNIFVCLRTIRPIMRGGGGSKIWDFSLVKKYNIFTILFTYQRNTFVIRTSLVRLPQLDLILWTRGGVFYTVYDKQDLLFTISHGSIWDTWRPLDLQKTLCSMTFLMEILL